MAEAAEIAGVSRRRINELRDKGRLPARKLKGGYWVTTRRHAEALRDELGPIDEDLGRRPGGRPRRDA